MSEEFYTLKEALHLFCAKEKGNITKFEIF